MARLGSRRGSPHDAGSSLLEAMAAVALSGLMLSSAVATLSASTSTLRSHNIQKAALDLARSQIETAIALPCGPPADCPPFYSCRVQRDVALLPNVQRPFWVIRLRAIVAAAGPDTILGDGISLSTLVTRNGPCRSG